MRLVLNEGNRRVYAYLHYADHGKNVTRYLGEATADDRATALKLAFGLARRKGLL